MSDAAAGLPGKDRARRFSELMRVMIVAGIPAGVVLIGLGSRVAMLVLRVTSPDRVRGVVSDDGFTIGEVTVAGSYNLLMLGAGVGVIGACAYWAVARRLIDPTWFRRLTTGLASAAVVGSMLIHSDGIDFTVLEPTWLAIGLFVALPGVFGALIGPTVDAVARPGSWTLRGRRRWLLPVVAIVCFPLSVFGVLLTSVVIGVGVLLADVGIVHRVRGVHGYAFAIRSVWLLIAVAGLFALVDDIAALT